MKRLVIGILAHVDSGKTTLSEGLLYTSGEITKLGRVDHKNAFLDTNEIERDRGITIFSKQAMIKYKDTEFTLLDTPGHVDFSAETERTLGVLDYAVLVINGADGVQSHTETLWKLLEHYSVPVFIFVNKMDLEASDKENVLLQIKTHLSDGCMDFESIDDDFYENVAMLDNSMLDEYLEIGSLKKDTVKNAINSRKLFPCFFGSALKLDGVEAFLDALDEYTLQKKYGNQFGARVFKISEDEKGQRLTHIKVTGGSLKVKTPINENGQKANELRIYSGIKYNSVQEIFSGGVCAVTGLTKTYPGQGLGCEHDFEGLVSEPVFTYSVKLPPDADIHTSLAIFRRLEEEETQMNVFLNEHLQRINVQIMGEVQLEVLKRVLAERFNLEVEFEHGSIIYKETILNKVEGVGHYEPLRHYSEVHLLIEPGERGSGIVLKSDCSEDVLDRNWQRLIMTHLEEKNHIGVLIGAPITDVKITLINGRAHQKHTEGGDFRQATYRAVRQGLMQAESIILEPYYSFTLEVPIISTGRALTDLQNMGAELDAPETKTDTTVITGKAPVSAISDYHKSVIEYTHGLGRFNCIFDGYAPCKNQDGVIEEYAYNAELDVENSADSVFCSHGSGFIVKWDKVFEYMHIPAIDLNPEQRVIEAPVRTATKLIADEEELLRIFENTYGRVKTKNLKPLRKESDSLKKFRAKPIPEGPVYLLIDGYNIIFAWDELKKIAEESLEDARVLLIDRICNYQAMKQNNVILVFDAYKVKGTQREVEEVHGISVVYTKEAETADQYIEKTSKQLSKKYRVRVATSDNLEQIIIFGHGAVRVSAMEFLAEVKETEQEIRKFIEENNRMGNKNE